MDKPRLGHIHFLNVLPLTYGLNHGGYVDGIDLHCGVPSVMNSDLLSNRLDVSEVSSIIYAKNYENLLILPDICVRADGKVQSILLVSKKPIHEINEDKIILTAQSATSHTFTKIILNKAYDANPRYYTRHISVDEPVPNDATASLLIGDDALNVYHHKDKEHYFYYDMGLEWKKLTGRCMVYAVWAVHKDFAKNHPEQLQIIYDRLSKSIRYGTAHKQEAIEDIVDSKPLSYGQIREYLDIIKWNLTEEYIDNLKIFYDYAYEMGLISKRPRIKIADVNR